LASLKKLRNEVLGLFDDHRVASQDQDGLHPLKRFLHFWILVGRSFLKNRCMIRATALAYTTLLSLVPLLVVGLGVTTSMLKTNQESTRDMVEQVIDNLVPQLELIPSGYTNAPPAAEEGGEGAPDTNDAPAVVEPDVPSGADLETAAAGADTDTTVPVGDAREEVIETIMGFIRNSNTAGVSAISTLTLILVAIGLLSTIEATFNDIWGVTRGRSWFARIIQYWAAITLGPLILLFATTFAVGAQFEAFQDQVFGSMGLTTLGNFLTALVAKFLPLFLVSIAFALLYQLMPATAVNWRAAIVGGLVAGFLWWINGQYTAAFASKVVSYSTVYGSAAVLPVFLLGLYLSWLILLFGAQVSYAFQNRRTYLQEKQAEVVSQRGREFVALRMMTRIAERFHKGLAPPSVTQLADELRVSSQLLARLVRQLAEARLLTEVNTANPGYVPARPLDQISCDDVLEILRSTRGRGPEPFTRQDDLRGPLLDAYEEICSASRPLARNRTLLMLVEESAAPASPKPNT
jgi:membrane protein